jgi:hypothetical protein
LDKGATALANIQKIECCSYQHTAATYELTSDNWFSERVIDFGYCSKCDNHLLQKRFTYPDGRVHEVIIRGKEKVLKKFTELVEKYGVGEIDPEYFKAVKYSGGLFVNLHYSDKGIEKRSDGLALFVPRKYDGERWLRKVSGRFQ